MFNTEKQRLFVDMDGTLARFHDQANYLERMFEKDFFRDLEPFENMVEGIRQFIHDHPDVEVFILSARVIGEPPYCEAEKNAWIDEHLPEIDQAHRIYTDMGKSKAEYIPGGISKNDYLLDDYNKGLNLWLYDGGSAIKCHNNINQRGLGAYGGSAGMLWTGDMVHTEDSPALISAELASHMGRSYSLESVLASSKTKIEYTEFMPGSRLNPNPFVPDVTCYLTKYLATAHSAERYEAKFTEPYYNKMDFQNPLNAIRLLEGRAGFFEYQLKTSDGLCSVPQFQADAVSSNLYGCPSFHKLYSNLDSKQLAEFADDFLSALEESKLPIVGKIDFLGSKGEVGETAVFHTVEEMKAVIQDCYDCGQPISANWFVTPKPPKEVTLYCSPDLGAPEEFTLSPDNLRMAARVCGFEFDDIDEFLSEYTWHESETIWKEYGQYVDQIATLLEGFGTREEVEAEFHAAMGIPGCSPVDAEKFILSTIEDWTRGHDDEALKAGVMDKAKKLLQSLKGSEVPERPKSSLDSMIFSAKAKQETPGMKSFNPFER